MVDETLYQESANLIQSCKCASRPRWRGCSHHDELGFVFHVLRVNGVLCAKKADGGRGRNPKRRFARFPRVPDAKMNVHRKRCANARNVFQDRMRTRKHWRAATRRARCRRRSVKRSLDFDDAFRRIRQRVFNRVLKRGYVRLVKIQTNAVDGIHRNRAECSPTIINAEISNCYPRVFTQERNHFCHALQLLVIRCSSDHAIIQKNWMPLGDRYDLPYFACPQ